MSLDFISIINQNGQLEREELGAEKDSGQKPTGPSPWPHRHPGRGSGRQVETSSQASSGVSLPPGGEGPVSDLFLLTFLRFKLEKPHPFFMWISLLYASVLGRLKKPEGHSPNLQSHFLSRPCFPVAFCPATFCLYHLPFCFHSSALEGLTKRQLP